MLGRVAAALCAVALLAGCTESSTGEELARSSGSPTATAQPTPGGAGTEASYAVDAPGPLTKRLLPADVLITGQDTLPTSMVDRIRALKRVDGVLPISLSASSIDGRTLTVAAVDPAEFRRYTPAVTAQADFVWERLAGGEVAVDNSVSRRLISKGDMMRLGNREDSPTVHVGAYAPLIQQATGVGRTRPAIQVAVNDKRGAQLGMPEDNALLVSTGTYTPSVLKKDLTRIIGKRATLQILALELDVGPQTALLTGTSVTDVVGTFTYTDGPDGTVRPDPAWVQEYIRTEEVPILGAVTCNKGMLPQLRGALTEVVQLGLSSKIHRDEYAGCYYPRYIGRDPSNGLSLHSWGIAVDLNVPGNQRGTVGEMDRQVVAIFKKWGFAWGGDWNYTDPMHFEMSRVVRAR